MTSPRRDGRSGSLTPIISSPGRQVAKTSESKIKLREESRDISHLSDARLAALGPPAPATLIPEQYHLVERTITAPKDPHVKTEYRDSDRCWHSTVWPSERPVDRREVNLLDEWLRRMLKELKATDPLEAVKARQKLYSMSFHELIRQVWVQLPERGQLMQKIWQRYLQLFEHILKMREHEREQYNHKINDHQLVYQQLYKEKDLKFSNLYMTLALEKQKITAAKDKLERSVLLLLEEHKQQLQSDITMRKLIKKLRKQAQGAAAGDDAGVDDDDEPPGPPDSLVDMIDVSSFSDANVALVQKLEFADRGLAELNAQLVNGTAPAEGLLAEVDTVVTAIKDIARRIVTDAQGPNGYGADSTSSAQSKTYVDRHTQTKASAVESSTEPMVHHAVPALFRPLFLDPDKGIPRIGTYEWVLRSISYVYLDKLAADQEADARKSPHAALPQFLYDHFVAMYGHRKPAELHLLDLLASLDKYLDSARVRVFAQFCGIMLSDQPPHTADLDVVLLALSLCHQEAAAPSMSTASSIADATADSAAAGSDEPAQAGGEGGRSRRRQQQQQQPHRSSEEEAGEGARSISISQADSILVTIFGNVATEEELDILQGRVPRLPYAVSRCDVDSFLELVAHESHRRSRQLEDELISMLESELGDAPLSYGDFAAIIHRLSTGRDLTDRQILRIFHEVVDRCGAHQKPDVAQIVEVLHAHQLVAWQKRTTPAPVDFSYKTDVEFAVLEAAWESEEARLTLLLTALVGSPVDQKLVTQLQEAIALFQKTLAKRFDSEQTFTLYRQLQQLAFAAEAQREAAQS